MQLETNKVVKLEIYDKKERFLTVTSLFKFPKELIKNKDGILMTFTGTLLEKIRCEDVITIVFVYANSSRYKCNTKVLQKDKTVYTVRVAEIEQLEERRRSFKVNINKAVKIYLSTDADAECLNGKIININLGGVLLKFEDGLPIGAEIWLRFIEVNLEFRTKILRRQTDINGVFVGYGCQFIDVSNTEEEVLAQYIMQCQVEERKRQKAMEM